jgi:zona occludens toxin
MVKWVDSSGNTADQLTFDQLIAMGYKVNIANFGVTLSARTYESVATAWPREAPRRESEPRLYRLDRDDDNAAPTSAASGRGVGVLTQSTSGGSIIGVGNRPMATFPESVQNRHSGG